MPNYNSEYTGAEIDESVENYFNAKSNGGYINASAILDLIYPVGSIYMSVNAVSPSTFIGGTWERIQDTFLLAAGSTYAAGGSGGNASHTHTYAHTHTTPATTTDSHTLTVAEMPSHNHAGIFYLDGNSSFPMVAYPGWDGNVSGYRTMRTDNATSGKGYTINPPSNGGGGGHTHGQKATTTNSQSTSTTDSGSSLPPYIAVYVWKRTA